MERLMPFYLEQGGERDHPLLFEHIRLWTKRCILGALLPRHRVTIRCTFGDRTLL